MRNTVINIVIQIAEQYNSEIDGGKIDTKRAENAPLFGIGGVLDSLGLVNFIVMVEQEIEDQMDKVIQIVSEKAMSQKTSPFLTIGTLGDFIVALIQESTQDE